MIVALRHVTVAPEVGLVVGILQHTAVTVHLGGTPGESFGGVVVGAAVVLLAFVGEGKLALHLLAFAVLTT